MDNLASSDLNELFEAVGAHLAAADGSASIVVVGGSNLAVRGWVDRTTKDVDVIAKATTHDGVRTLHPAEPLPDVLKAAVAQVALDYRLPEDWLNTVIGAQWTFGLPPGFAEEVEWRAWGPLEVGFAGRASIVALKLFAVVDAGIGSVHFQDLVALDPSPSELQAAAEWVASQDAGTVFPELLEEALHHVERSRGRGGRNG